MLESRFVGLEHQFGELRERMAHLEGLQGAPERNCEENMKNRISYIGGGEMRCRHSGPVLRFLAVFAVFLLLTSGNAYSQDTVEGDRAALVALYNATDGPNWTDNTNWLSNEPLSEWYGVTTNDDGRVTELSLGDEDGGNQLTGEIPVGTGSTCPSCSGCSSPATS